MKILIIYANGLAEISNRKSALGSYILTLSNIFKERLGWDVYINGVPVSNIHASDTIVTSNESRLKKYLKKSIPAYFKQLIKIRSIFNRNRILLEELLNNKSIKYDRVIEFYTIGSEVGLRYCNQRNTFFSIVYDSPVIEQEKYFNRYLPYSKRIEKFELSSLLSSNKIMVYSEPVKLFLLNRIHLDESKFMIHQNVDYSRLDFIEVSSKVKAVQDPINICFLGSFLKWHRIDLLITAFEKLADEGANIRLHLIGDGMDFPRISSIVEKSVWRKWIFMPGFLDGNELKEYKRRMDIGIMAGSNWYGAPNKIFEYGAAGMAVVSCSTPTIDFVFDSKLISKFDMNNLDTLSSCIRRLIHDNDLLISNAKNLQSHIQNNYNELKTIEKFNLFLNN